MTDYPNGRLPESALATTYLYYPGTNNGRQLLKEVVSCAEAWATAYYLRFGKPLTATDGYRSLAEQQRLIQPPPVGVGPGLAAPPGTSVHGYGKALDLGAPANDFDSPEWKWLAQTARTYGFVHPSWAREGGGREEPWHFEFVGRGEVYPRVVRPKAGEIGLGHTGASVRAIQTLLKNRGYDTVVDGRYGLGTAIDVLRFQGAHGLNRDGNVDERTMARLKPRPRHTRVTTRATHVYEAPGRGEGRLLEKGQHFTVWDGAAVRRGITWWVQTTSGNWVRSLSTRKVN